MSATKVQITVEAKTAAAAKAMAELGAAAGDAKQSVDDLAEGVGGVESKSKTAAKGLRSLGDDASKAGKHAVSSKAAFERLGFAAHQVAAGTATASQALQGVAATLGPLGIAAGAAIGLIVHLADAHREAAKAAKEHRIEAAKTAAQVAYDREIERGEQAREYKAMEREKANAELAIRRERERSDLARAAAPEIEALEEAVATAKATGADATAFENQLTRERIKLLREQARVGGELPGFEVTDTARALAAEADSLERSLGLSTRVGAAAKVVADENRRAASAKRDQLSLEEKLFKSELARAKLYGGTLEDASKAGAFDRGRAADDAIAQARKDVIGSQLERTPRKSALDIEREKIALLQEAREAAASSSKALHEAEMARQKALQDRAEKAGIAVGDSLASIAQLSLQAGDLSARGFRRVLAECGKAESIKLASIAISEAVQALVSAATYNFGAAAMHGAAAAQAGLGAAAIVALTGAVGGFGSIAKKPTPGFSGEQFGAGAAETATTPTTSNSQADTTPLSTKETAQHISKKPGPGGTTIVVNAQVLGAIDKTTGLKLAQGIRAAERSLGRSGS